MVLYVDDQFVDGYQTDVDWYYSLLAKRFKIKPPQSLAPDSPLDHLGMGIFCTDSQGTIYFARSKLTYCD